ncbi:MSHA biogenesis protein MshQ [Vibrio navarrensis]
MMTHKWLLSLLLVCGSAFSQQYNLALNQFPPCNTSWQVSGNTYTCSGDGKVTLNSGDTVIANAESTLVANNGFELRGNTIGTTSNPIHLQAQYGQIETLTTQTTTLYGNITANSSNVTLSNIALYGNITTGGNITLNTGVVQGNLTSSNNSVSVTNVQLTGNITANSSVTMTGGTYSGDITLLANNPVTFNSVTMTSGSVSGASHFNATNSQIGSPDSPVTIATTSNDITLTNTTVYGDLTAATNNAGGVVHVDGNSSVIGSCLPVSSPTNACAPAPVALYRFDETQWTGQVGEVKNTFSTSLYGRARNGASTNNIDPALSPDTSNMGTCGYGEFVANQNQYVEVPHDSQLSLSNQLTVSAWVYPTSRPASGSLYTIVSKDTNYEFHLDSAGHVFWYWQRSNGSANSLTTTETIPLNTWSHITIRYDNSLPGNQRQKIYINGVAVESGNDSNSLRTNTLNLEIGRDYNFDSRSFDGRIDEVAIYSRALSDSQILDLYNQRHQCSGPTLQCFSDSFDSSLSDLWVTSTSKGTFQPGVVNGRLRFTQAVGNQSTSSSYQRLFPARDNLVEVEFDHFAYDGTGADGIAVVLSDARVTPRAGAFGGPLGYGFKPNEPGFAGGWLGIGIDEYGNFSNEGGEGAMPGRRRQSVALRGSGEDETGYRYLAGACNNGTTNTNGSCLDPTVDNNNSGDIHRYKIVVDSRVSNQSQVEILRKVGSGNWQTIVGPLNVLDSQYNQAAVPDDFLLSITGSTGGSNNIHEIDNFQVCALDSRPIAQQIDHFRIIHTGQGVTCSAESVTILACNNADCSELFTDPVQATLSPATVSGGGGWVGGNVINFSGGSTTVEIRKNQPGSITLGVSGSSPTTKPFATTLCQTGGGWSASHCSTTFADSGFVIDVPDFIASSSATATIKAVKTSDASLQCVPEFANVDKTINFWSSYIAPDSSSVVGSPAVSINTEEIGKSQALASAIPMTFNASGEASFTLNYPDAGRMQLNARYQGSGAENGLLMVGSDQFVSFPKYLQISASNSQSDNGQCTTANTSCDVFAAAGESFDLLVTAYGEGDVVTPNYQHSNMALTHTLVAPVSGQAGTLSTASYQQVPIVGGTNTVEQSVSEVGVFNFTVTPPATYLGSSAYTINAASTGNIGRFIPAYFAVSPMTVALEAACSAGAQPFTYLGQPFGYASNSPLGLYLQPKSGGGTDTLNYLIGEWWRYDNQWTDRAYHDAVNNLPIDFTNELAAPVTRQSPSTSGVMLNGEQLRYQKPVDPTVPFTANVNLNLLGNDLIDEEGRVIRKADLRDRDDVCYRTTYSEPCLDYTFENIDQTMTLYWGRLRVHDTYGPETNPLSQKVQAQYFSSGIFRTNSDDSCSDLGSVNHFTFDSTDFTVLKSGTATPPEVKATLAPSLLSSGVANIDLSAPGARNTGTIVSSYDLSTLLPWLRVDEDGNNSFEDSVSGRVQFGLYRGSDRVIWWRESN